MRDDEMISLNLDELDVEELERRLELAVVTAPGGDTCGSKTGTCNGYSNCNDISWTCSG